MIGARRQSFGTFSVKGSQPKLATGLSTGVSERRLAQKEVSKGLFCPFSRSKAGIFNSINNGFGTRFQDPNLASAYSATIDHIIFGLGVGSSPGFFRTVVLYTEIRDHQEHDKGSRVFIEFRDCGDGTPSLSETDRILIQTAHF